MLTSLGTENFSATSALTRFLAAHGEVLAQGLAVPLGHGPDTPAATEELALLSGCVAATGPATSPAFGDPAAMETAAQAVRLQQRLLGLLPHVLPKGQLAVAIDQLPENQDGVNVRQVATNGLLATLAAVLSHPAVRRTGTDVATRDMAVVFRPSMATAGHGLATVAGRMPSLGVLAECCAQAVARVGVARAAREAAHQDLDGLDTNTSVEQLQRWVPQAGPTTGEHKALDQWNFYIKNKCIRCQCLILKPFPPLPQARAARPPPSSGGWRRSTWATWWR